MSNPTNPYESPRSFPVPSTQTVAPFVASEPRDETIAALEARVAELERQLAQSWFLSPNSLKRIAAVFGYWIIGYVIVALLIVPIMMLISLLLHL